MMCTDPRVIHNAALGDHNLDQATLPFRAGLLVIDAYPLWQKTPIWSQSLDHFVFLSCDLSLDCEAVRMASGLHLWSDLYSHMNAAVAQ